MIESEQKRQDLMALVQHWAEHTKASRELRPGDDPKEEPKHNYVHQRYLSEALAFDEHCPKCVKDKELTDQWQTHKATKVIESGEFCPDCGLPARYTADGSAYHICLRGGATVSWWTEGSIMNE